MSRLKIGLFLKATRKKLGKTQRQVANEIGIDQAVLSKIENGRFSGSIRLLEQYLDYLDCELLPVAKTPSLPDFDDIEGMFDDD